MSQGEQDCENRCTLHADCNYYSYWNSKWCKLSNSCTWTNAMLGYSIVIRQQTYLAPLPTPAPSTTTSTTTTESRATSTPESVEVNASYQVFKEPSTWFCSDDPALFESFSTGLDDCLRRCTLDATCHFSSFWTTKWCRLTQSCSSTAQLGTYSITIYEKVTHAPRELEFLPADGGTSRACRGESVTDNKDSYFQKFSFTPSLQACQSLCEGIDACRGIEYNEVGQRCEVWTREEGVGATRELSGYTCQHAVPRGSFAAFGGEDMTCRGAHAADKRASYFTALEVNTLNDCKGKCLDALGCKGIAFSGSRCEVWTRPEGIHATAPSQRTGCWLYEAVATTGLPRRARGVLEDVDSSAPPRWPGVRRCVWGIAAMILVCLQTVA